MTTQESTRERLLGITEVMMRLGCSRRSIYRLDNAGKMPRSIRLGGMLRWREAAIDKWIADGCPDRRKSEGGDA
jgi:excisionase family DNA binding protein